MQNFLGYEVLHREQTNIHLTLYAEANHLWVFLWVIKIGHGF